MLHEIVIQLKEETAAELQKQPADATLPVLQLASDLNVELVAHQPVEHGEVCTFFSIMQSDAETARQTAERFASCEGVTAAYVKPQGTPP